MQVQDKVRLEILTEVVECMAKGVTWETLEPKGGLSLELAAEASRLCADREVEKGGGNYAREWLWAFNEAMRSAGFGYIVATAQDRQYWKIEPPAYPFDPGWIAVH